MKAEQYHKLMQKFLNGETNSSEEKLLKNSEYLTDEDSIYFNVLENEKEEVSNLNFAQFLDLAEKNEKIIPLVPKTSNFKWIWLAAAVAFIFSIGLFYFSNTENKEKAEPQFANTEVYQKEKTEIFAENTYQPEADSTKIEPQKIVSSDKILDQILPRKSRMKKVVRTRYVENSKTPVKPVIPEYESGYVIVNGHKITNEKDAIDVTKYSFQVLANNVNQSIQQADVIQSLNFEN